MPTRPNGESAGTRRDYHAEAAKETDDSLAKVIERLEAAIQAGGANTGLINGQLNAYRKEQKRRKQQSK